jgi:micrococcal nuclease
VLLVRDTEARDRYDRLLAYVYREDGMFVNLALVDSGHAAAFPFEPNTTFADDFRAAEENARRLHLGLWGRCGGPDVPAGSLAS